MLMNLINLTYEAHSLGRSLDAHLLHRFGAEYHAPLLLNPHPNIVRVRHHYQGDTSHFRSYLHLLVPPSLDVPIEMARRTTFLVLDQYPQTLQSFMEGQLREGLVPPADRLWQQFVLQLVYQLLAALGFLQRHHVVHRDIKADNVFLDWRLRPVLGDFGFARTLRGYGGQALPFTDKDQVFAGNPHAWAPELCRLSRTDPDTLPQPVSGYDPSNLFTRCRSLGACVRVTPLHPHPNPSPFTRYSGLSVSIGRPVVPVHVCVHKLCTLQIAFPPSHIPHPTTSLSLPALLPIYSAVDTLTLLSSLCMCEW